MITVLFFSTATTCWWYWWLALLWCFLCQFVQVKQQHHWHVYVHTCMELVLLLGHWMEEKWPSECTLRWVMVVLTIVHTHSVAMLRPTMVHLECLRPFIAVSECSLSENVTSYLEWRICASNMFFQLASWTIAIDLWNIMYKEIPLLL